ncbi:hypothetical protein ACAW68_04525 [Weissella confusa]|uniref:hypothetical protein n=1 Tax=Weissella confusa TaxID=1583 RepID=UPI0035A32C0F
MKSFISGAYASPDKHNLASSNVFNEINLYIVLAIQNGGDYHLGISEKVTEFDYFEPLTIKNGVPVNDLDLWEIQRKLCINLSKLEGTQILEFVIQLSDNSKEVIDSTVVKVLHQKLD